VEQKDFTSTTKGNDHLALGFLKVTSLITTEEQTLPYALVYRGRGESSRTLVGTPLIEADFVKSKPAVLDYFDAQTVGEFFDYCRKLWNAEVFTLADMFFEKRQAVIELLLEDSLAQISASYAHIYARQKGILQNLRALHLPIPEEFAVPARHTLSRRLLREIERLRNTTKESPYRHSIDIVQTADYLGLKLNVQKVSRIFQSMLESRLAALRASLSANVCQELLRLTQIGDRLKLELNETPIQNLIYFILQERITPLIDDMLASEGDGNYESQYAVLDMVLRLAYRFNFTTKIYKDRLKAVEQALSQDPRFWP
jgi:hypothetical protein